MWSERRDSSQTAVAPRGPRDSEGDECSWVTLHRALKSAPRRPHDSEGDECNSQVTLHRARKSASRRARASSARAVRRAGSRIEQQWIALNTARDTSCYTRHEAVLVSCCTTLTIAHSDAFRAHDDHTLAERVDSQDTAEYALSRSSSLDDDARSGSPPRPRRTRTARRRERSARLPLVQLLKPAQPAVVATARPPCASRRSPARTSSRCL